MRRRIVAPLLVAAALAIGVQNWLFFYGGSASTPIAATDEEIAAAESGDDALASEQASAAIVRPPPILGAPALATLLVTFDGLRSPFLPKGIGSSEGHGIPSLTGLLIGAERRIAWLGSHARSEGELYQGFKVARVEPARVVLERDGRRFSLWLDAPDASDASDATDLDRMPGLEEEKTP